MPNKNGQQPDRSPSDDDQSEYLVWVLLEPRTRALEFDGREAGLSSYGEAKRLVFAQKATVKIIELYPRVKGDAFTDQQRPRVEVMFLVKNGGSARCMLEYAADTDIGAGLVHQDDTHKGDRPVLYFSQFEVNRRKH